MAHLTAPLSAILLFFFSTSTLAVPLALPQDSPNGIVNTTVYPQKSPGDAPYDVPEATLRAAIKLPANFEP